MGQSIPKASRWLRARPSWLPPRGSSAVFRSVPAASQASLRRTKPTAGTACWYCHKILHPRFIPLEPNFAGFNLKIQMGREWNRIFCDRKIGAVPLRSLLRSTELGNIEGPEIDVRLIKGSFLCSLHTAITSAGQFLSGEQIRADYQRERRTPVRKGGRRISIFFPSSFFLSSFILCLMLSHSLSLSLSLSVSVSCSSKKSAAIRTTLIKVH